MSKNKLIDIIPGTIYKLDDPEFVGRMRIRQEIEVLDADDPNKEPIGWTIVKATSKRKLTIYYMRTGICKIYQKVLDFIYGH